MSTAQESAPSMDLCAALAEAVADLVDDARDALTPQYVTCFACEGEEKLWECYWCDGAGQLRLCPGCDEPDISCACE